MAASRKSLTVDVPFIIESFPAPPTHIPPSPSPATKYPPQLPPPSRPPTQPLPPVPGPSPITDHESLVLLSTRHGSKYNVDRISIISSRGSRDSFYSARSVVLASPMPKEDSSPIDSPISLEVKEEHYDDDGSSAYEGIVVDDVLTLSPPPKIRDLVGPPPSPPMDEQELTINIPALISSSSSSSSPNPDPNDSISSISMDDLPGPDDDDDDVVLPSSTAEVEAATHALQVHLEMRTARSRSIGHKKMLLSRQSSGEPPNLNDGDHSGRSPSPDITTIIETTPRPRMRPKRSASDASHLGRTPSQPSLKQRWSAASDGPGRRSRGRDTWDVDGFLDNYAEMDEVGGSDSDSSIDLQTPYSHILLKDGVLSPNSKSLPDGIGSRPQSIASVMTSITKSGLIKDSRDTPQRRTRHRDGKTLRGGIGLTTGLGWSDSEDEDAPSELTRRISTLRMSTGTPRSRSSSRAVSAAGGRSLRSARSFTASTSSHHYPVNSSMSRSSSQSSLRPFPSSMSRDTLLETEEEWEESGEREHLNSLPPTSWKKSQARKAADSSKRGGGFYKDTPLSAASSSSSLQLTSSPLPPSPMLPHSAPAGVDFDEDMSLTTTVSLRRDKTLPPLPPLDGAVPGPVRELRKQASSSRLAAPRARASSLARSFPTPSPVDSSMTTTSATTTTGISGPRSSTGSIQAPRTSLPRTLKLPMSRSLTQQRSSGVSGDRPAVPVPGLGSTTASTSSIPSPTATFAMPSTPSRPSSLSKSSTGPGSALRRPSIPSSVFTPTRTSSNVSTAGRPRLSAPAGDASPSVYSSTPLRGPGASGGSGIAKPRIGTGMVYRKSGGSASSASSAGRGLVRPAAGKAF